MESNYQQILFDFKKKLESQEVEKEWSTLFDDLMNNILQIEEKIKNDIVLKNNKISHLEKELAKKDSELSRLNVHCELIGQNLNHLLSSLPNLIYIKNINLKYEIVNHAFETWMNTNASDIIGKEDAEVFPDYFNRDIGHYEQEVILTGNGIFNLEECIRIDGKEINLLTNIVPYKNSKGDCLGIITNSLDITNLKNREKELEEANKSVWSALNVKNEFLSNVSHEFRTPLHAIAGSTEMIEEQELQPENKQLLQVIKQSSQQLLHLMNDLLMYSQADKQSLEEYSEEFDLRSELMQIIQSHQLIIGSKGVDLRYFVDEKIPVHIIGDKSMINRLVGIFLSNGIKFTDKGFVHIIIKQTGRSGKDIKIKFDITDTGIGIPKKQQDIIFELFSAGDTSSIKKYSGTGLGLSLAQKLLNKLNASYGFESKEHMGSHFWFEIPFQTNSIQHSLSSIKSSDIPVLLVEDNVVNQKIAYFSLRKLGFPVDIAENGQEAIDKFKQSNYKLVLMDIQMPVMDGFEATKLIREFEKSENRLESSVIIALSANVLSKDIHYCFEIGMNEFVSKPFSSEKLMEKIKIYFNLQ